MYWSCCLIYVIIILFLVIYSGIILFWLDVLRLLFWSILRESHWLSLSSLHWLLVWYLHWLFFRNTHRLPPRSFGIAYWIGIQRRLNTLISNCCNGFFAVFGLLALILCLIKFFFLRVLINCPNWKLRFILHTLFFIDRRLWPFFTHYLLFIWDRYLRFFRWSFGLLVRLWH